MLLIERDVHQMSWSWENMNFDMNQSRKRREESVIRKSTKDFFVWKHHEVKSNLQKPTLLIKRTQHC